MRTKEPSIEELLQLQRNEVNKCLYWANKAVFYSRIAAVLICIAVAGHIVQIILLVTGVK